MGFSRATVPKAGGPFWPTAAASAANGSPRSKRARLVIPPSLGLPPACRIKQGRDFSRARAEGKRLAQGALAVNWLALPAGSRSRLGVITGRKIGNAVVRSRARRLLRESFRLHQHELNRPVDLIVVARPSIAGKTFAEVERDLMVALHRSNLLKSAK